MKYVIIGNGTAAVGAIEGIRSADKVGPITVISTEPYHVYGRPLISYMLLGKTTEEKMLQYRPDDFYEKNNVTTMLGRTVQHIDPKKQTVSLTSGESVPYDRLCICTGSRPFVPPMEGLDTVENKTSFMTLDDAKHLNEMLGETNDKRVLIVGAGLIGLKCAEGIYQRVSELTVIDLAPRILPNVLTEVPAAIIQKHIESKGVKFLLGDSVAQFEPNKAHLKSGGTIDFDILVVAVGVRPNTELAAEAGINPNTVQRAFSELEREGLIYTQRATGKYVTENADEIKSARQALAKTQIAEFLSNMQSLGYSVGDVIVLLQSFNESEEENKHADSGM